MNQIVLEGQRVKLLLMTIEHMDELYECGQAPDIWAYLPMKV